MAVDIKKFWTEDSKNNSLFKGCKDQLAVPENCEYIKVPLFIDDILKNKNIHYYYKRNDEKYADMQQLLTQASNAVINIANNCLEADKSSTDFCQSVYLLGENLPEVLRKAKSRHFLDATISKRQKTGLGSTKKGPSTSSESLNYQGRKKNYSGPQHQQSRQNQRNSFHRYQKRN